MGKWTVIEGSKHIVEANQKKLGGQAQKLGALLVEGTAKRTSEEEREYQECFGKFIPGMTEEKLLNAFARIMPCMNEKARMAIIPSVLLSLGSRVEMLTADPETVALLAHILDPKENNSEEQTLIEEITQIKEDLALISENWKLVFDPNGNSYIDIVGQPKLPTSMALEKEVLKPQYEKVNIATVYLEEPATELERNAVFITLAPGRVKRLLELLEEKARN